MSRLETYMVKPRWVQTCECLHSCRLYSASSLVYQTVSERFHCHTQPHHVPPDLVAFSHNKIPNRSLPYPRNAQRQAIQRGVTSIDSVRMWLESTQGLASIYFPMGCGCCNQLVMLYSQEIGAMVAWDRGDVNDGEFVLLPSSFTHV